MLCLLVEYIVNEDIFHSSLPADDKVAARLSRSSSCDCRRTLV